MKSVQFYTPIINIWLYRTCTLTPSLLSSWITEQTTTRVNIFMSPDYIAHKASLWASTWEIQYAEMEFHGGNGLCGIGRGAP